MKVENQKRKYLIINVLDFSLKKGFRNRFMPLVLSFLSYQELLKIFNFNDKTMFKTPSGDRYKTFILTLLILLVAVSITWFLGEKLLAVLLAVISVLIISIARSIFSTDKSNFLLRSLVLTIFSGVVAGNVWWQPFVESVFESWGWQLSSVTWVTDWWMILIAAVIVVVVFYFTQEKAVIDTPNKKITDLIEGPTIKQKWASICESLSNHIRDIDRATNWSHEYYTPLDAEVEMKTSKGTKKVVKDLLDAIKESEDRLFLLIGDPGAGKSVALRKLCLDILKESVEREYIPIYVNLKEWVSSKDWTKEKPTWQDLEVFVKQSLTDKDRYLGDFFEQYYNTLDENGNLFFVLDSFDEMPQVLGTTADSQLIEDLSIVCREFLQGAKQRRSKGILASREYRMPREEYFGAKTILWVRPFTEEKIGHSLSQSGRISKSIVKQLLRERPELVPSLRNPFITSLLKSYLENNNNQFPKNQADLFENYIRKSIETAQKRRGLTHIAYADILSVTIQIAKIIFSEAGLQAPLSMLRAEILHPHFDSIVEIMRYTRIARGDVSQAHEFSFAHRRFYEYFIVQDLLRAGRANLPLENIPTDSRWRDTLVLYCEVADFAEAQRIANYCWFEVIAKHNNISNRASKHCLRFLTEAFRGRQEALVDFHDELGQFVLGQIDKKNDPINIKLAVEALVILKVNDLDKGAVAALKMKDYWISDTAIRGFRHLNTISKELEKNILITIDYYPKKTGEKDKTALPKLGLGQKELLTSFKLSNAFEDFVSILEWQLINQRLFGNILIIYFFLGLIGLGFLRFSGFLVEIGNSKLLLGSNPITDFVLFALGGLVAPAFLSPIFGVVTEFYMLRNNKYYKYSNNISIEDVLQWLLFSVIVALVFVGIIKTILYIQDWLKIDSQIIDFVFKRIIDILGMILIVLRTYIYVKDRKFYRKIEKRKLNDRVYIEKTFSKLQNGDYVNKFISDLENNIKNVNGSFSEGFLEVGHSPEMTRLIQLEERWREAEEREAERTAQDRKQ